MDCLRQLLATLAVCVSMSLFVGCGGGGGSGSGSSSAPTTPPEAARDLRLLAAHLPDQAVAVPTSATWLFTFDADVAADVSSALVQLDDSQGTVPVIVDVFDGWLRVRPAQPLRMRTDYTLTVKAGLKASNGAVLRSDVVRRFQTILMDGVNQVIQPDNRALPNFAGQHTFRIGDLNGDGRPDIVQIGGDAALVFEGNSFAVNVFLQDADHSFSRAQNVLIREAQHLYGNEVGDIGIIDLDHDGVPEIVISIQRPLPGLNGLLVLKQDARGRYAAGDFIATDYAYRLFIADISRDGKPDLLGIGQGLDLTDGPDRCGMVAVLSRAGGPRAQPPTILPCGPYEAVLGPLERPGQLDLVLLRTSFTVPVQPFQQRLSIYSLDEQGRPTLNSGLMAAAAPVCAGLLDCTGPMLIDVNGDGIQELLFRTALVSDSTAVSVIYARNDSGTYSEFARQSFGGAYAFMVADMDRDGLEDVVVVVQGAGSYVAAGFTKRNSGLELSHLLPVSAFDTMSQATVGIADLDGDGLPDVVLDSYNSGVSVLFQRRQ